MKITLKRVFSLKFLLRFCLVVLLIFVLLFAAASALVYYRQAALVQYALDHLNKNFRGQIRISGSSIAPFANFPYISIDLKEVEVYEDKTQDNRPILKVKDVYVGFDFWQIWAGVYDIKTLRFSDGVAYLIQHHDGHFNLLNALSLPEEPEAKAEPSQEEASPFELHLQAIRLDKIDFHKYNEATDIDIDLFIQQASLGFKTKADDLQIGLDALFELNVMSGKDTINLLKHKHLELHTRLHYFADSALLKIDPSELKLEQAGFELQGLIYLDEDLNLDLKAKGTKPNFDLFLAFAPEDLAPTLKAYGNKGKVFFETEIKGPSANGKMPLIEAKFGCSEGSIENNRSRKKLQDLAFSGYFTNGAKRDFSTMELRLQNFQAKPDAGIFTGDLRVVNFDSPEIDLKLRSDFKLEFLSKFFNLKNLEDMDGRIALTMNFRDIIDLQNPERSIERLNESYFTELEVEDLSFRSTNYPLPIEGINLRAIMEGHEAKIEYFRARVGGSDISIKGSISDLPAVLHHTNDKVEVNLSLSSQRLDLTELTRLDSTKASLIDEVIEGFRLNLGFISSAKALTESKHLPVGEFILRDFQAKFKNYPHHFHDFHADIFIQDEDIRIADFSGALDGSDFHISGKLQHYDIWLKPELVGDCILNFDWQSKHFRPKDLFTYKGVSYLPPDYQQEDFQDLDLRGRVALHFGPSGLSSTDLYLDNFCAKMQVHKAKFEQFKGRVHFEDEHLVIESLTGRLGRSDIKLYLNYYLGNNPLVRKRDNFLSLKASVLDFDQLLDYQLPSPEQEAKLTQAEKHDSVFNVFSLPFTDMRMDLDIGRLSYHRYLLEDFQTRLRIQANHYLYVDTCRFRAAGGQIDFKGYFNGSDPQHIYFSPDMWIEQVDLDKVLFKFENFGQDHLVSEQLHGLASCHIRGKILMHADLTPILDKSDLIIDAEITQGRLENFAPVMAMSDFFQDKNLSKIFFDTLTNSFEVKQGKITIPTMTINSSLGFMELSGEQDLAMNMTYFFKIPLKLVTQIAFQKLFKRKREEVDLDREDAIQYQDPTKKTRYINLKYEANADTYKISLFKDKRAKQERRAARRAKREAKKAAKMEQTTTEPELAPPSDNPETH